ncbi:MAG: tyrosine-type recombinase/integrase [Oscillospiraceae bacterium]|nr:tyrosine-type recombinase/integrase [Oscillospiraceae bacterium]
MVLSVQKLRAFAEYLIREEKSRATQEKYLRDVEAFYTFAGRQELTKELVIGWKKSLLEQGYAARSVNSMIASVNSLLDYLGLSCCKAKSLRMQHQSYCGEDQELTKAEYLRLLTASGRQKQLNLVLQTICGTGIRVSELSFFTVEAVKAGEVTVDCKNKTRRILIPNKLKKALLRYAQGQHILSGAIFVTRTGKPLDRSNIWAAMKKLCAAAGVKESKVFPHNLRKLFARTFYGMDKDIAKLADILGHSSINTTRIYIITTGSEHRRRLERLGLVI